MCGVLLAFHAYINHFSTTEHEAKYGSAQEAYEARLRKLSSDCFSHEEKHRNASLELEKKDERLKSMEDQLEAMKASHATELEDAKRPQAHLKVWKKQFCKMHKKD